LITSPNFKFLFKNPAHFLALGFGSGLSPKAPGTFGTIVGMPMFILLMATPALLHTPIIALLFLIGIPLCDIAGKNLGVPDHRSIVWDEIVAFMLVMEYSPFSWIWWLIAFLLFRLFDIWKPFPIHFFDQTLKGGFGVMFDDLLAAIYAIISLKALLWLTMHY
jgi:phosphatidylglycerophosphatase A